MLAYAKVITSGTAHGYFTYCKSHIFSVLVLHSSNIVVLKYYYITKMFRNHGRCGWQIVFPLCSLVGLKNEEQDGT